MSLFNYIAIDKEGKKNNGSIDAVNMEVAISSLQKRGLIISSIVPEDKQKLGLFSDLSFFKRITTKDIVFLSRQIATLFEAQVSALRVFRLIAAETENPKLRDKMSEVAEDIQGGSSISEALAQHPKVFSEFYVNMVKAGEESGKLNDTFNYLADYIDRSFEDLRCPNGRPVLWLPVYQALQRPWNVWHSAKSRIDCPFFPFYDTSRTS